MKALLDILKEIRPEFDFSASSDFIADALNQWWDERGPHYAGVKRLQIELDNGPEINS